MSSKMTLKMWLGLGTAMVIAGNSAHAHDAMQHGDAPAHQMQVAQSHAPGDGGEGGESGIAADDPEQFLTSSLMLIRGHLLIGAELFRAGQTMESLPHFLHPKEEILDGIKETLKARDAMAVEKSLSALVTAARANDAAAFEVALTTVHEDLDAALATTPQVKRDNPAFTLKVAVDILKVAADEYAAAIEGNRIVNVVEYQDSRGFLFAATQMVEAIESGLTAQDADAYATIKDTLDDLATNWPTAEAPHNAVKTPEQVASAVSKFELHIGRFE